MNSTTSNLSFEPRMRPPAFRRISKSLAALCILTPLFASAADAQQAERRLPEASVQVGTVTEKSQAVSLKAIGKEVAPGVFEVDPDAIRGKRLTIPRGQTLKHVCIGRWREPECKGIYIEF